MEPETNPSQGTVRALVPGAVQEVELETIAERMGQTLTEVLGSERGGTMYSREWLLDRVRFHLNPQLCTGAVLVYELNGALVGHAIVREQQEEWQGETRTIGLLSTIYVLPANRGAGVASKLLDAAEAWFAEHGLHEMVTYTAPWNTGLQRLMNSRGYTCTPVNEDFVRLCRHSQ